MEGSIPLHQAPVGSCEIWGSRPSLWFPVAETLGFTITAARFRANLEFIHVMRRLYPNVNFGRRRKVTSPVLFSLMMQLFT